MVTNSGAYYSNSCYNIFFVANCFPIFYFVEEGADEGVPVSLFDDLQYFAVFLEPCAPTFLKKPRHGVCDVFLVPQKVLLYVLDVRAASFTFRQEIRGDSFWRFQLLSVITVLFLARALDLAARAFWARFAAVTPCLAGLAGLP